MVLLHACLSFDSGNVATRLEFTSDAALSRTFSTFRPELLQLMTTQPLTQENHQFAISPQVFTGDAKLSQFFQVLSTSKDKQGVEYVSSVEARQVGLLVPGAMLPLRPRFLYTHMQDGVPCTN